jgi:mycothiol synthase
MRRPHLRDLPTVPPLSAGYALRVAAGERDAAALAAVLTAAFDDAWTADRVRRTLTDAPDVRAVYLVESQGHPVATASSRWLPDRFPGAGVVHWVGTHPDHARLGLGSVLLRRVLLDFGERGDPEAVLQTDTFRLPAIRAYLRFGFVPVYRVDGVDHQDRWSAVFQALFDGRQPGSPRPEAASTR